MATNDRLRAADGPEHGDRARFAIDRRVVDEIAVGKHQRLRARLVGVLRVDRAPPHIGLAYESNDEEPARATFRSANARRSPITRGILDLASSIADHAGLPRCCGRVAPCL